MIGSLLKKYIEENPTKNPESSTKNQSDVDDLFAQLSGS